MTTVEQCEARSAEGMQCILVAGHPGLPVPSWPGLPITTEGHMWEGGAATSRHPESYCHRCGGPNVVWVAPSPLWNEVMRGGSITGVEQCEGIVCPTCFVVLAEEQGVADGWRLTADCVHVELETVTPSGRVWDRKRWLWR